MDEEVLERLEKRMGRLHANQRLGIEIDHEAQIFGQGLSFFHIENWYSIHSVIRAAFKLTGLYRRGAKNAERVQVRHTDLQFKSLPKDFDTFTVLHISDLHVDMNRGAMQRTLWCGISTSLTRPERSLRSRSTTFSTLEYDLCVLNGDYRGETFGPFEPALNGLAEVRAQLKGPIYGVLGNHDTIRMVPRLEDMGIRMLLNECETVSRGHQQIYLAGIDDAHFYRVDNLEKAAADIPPCAFSILLSHTPEIYRQATHAGFDLLLSGHTHGGQICLPGSIPLTLDSRLPRRLGSGLWKYQRMVGYPFITTCELSRDQVHRPKPYRCVDYRQKLHRPVGQRKCVGPKAGNPAH